MELITGENDEGRRLDRILRKALPDHPLPLIHKLLRKGQVLLDGRPAKAQDRVNLGVKISIPSFKKAKPDLTDKPAASLASPDIIWQENGLLAVNKPPGISVHGPNSLDSMVQLFLKDKLPASLSFKPGPLHRLDKPTSGIVIFSSSLEGARLFSSLMRERKVRKTYLAVVEGIIKKEEIWQDDLIRDKEMKKTFIDKNKTSGKTALTSVKPLVVKDNYTLIEAEILTGRTHQIRAQAAFHGHPIAGDKKYGGYSNKNGYFFLHAWKLEFLNFSIKAPLPPLSPSSPYNEILLTKKAY
ncbi:MAG: RluA family pseudouridine synthase [Treponema sp.]|nr:RluA family pseudouridine synthase [Treponema sp.]